LEASYDASLCRGNRLDRWTFNVDNRFDMAVLEPWYERPVFPAIMGLIIGALLGTSIMLMWLGSN